MISALPLARVMIREKAALSPLFSDSETAEADVISIALCGVELQEVRVKSAMQTTLTARILM
jgi:hypothetical protein